MEARSRGVFHHPFRTKSLCDVACVCDYNLNIQWKIFEHAKLFAFWFVDKIVRYDVILFKQFSQASKHLNKIKKLTLANLNNPDCLFFNTPHCLLARCCASCTRWLLVAIHAAPLSRNPQIKMLLTKPFFLFNRVLLTKSHYGSPRGDVFPSSQVLRFPLLFIFIFSRGEQLRKGWVILASARREYKLITESLQYKL